MPDRGPGGVERVLDGVHTLGESPVWSVREQALYWVDLRAPALFRWDGRAPAARTWSLPELVGGVVLGQDGMLLLALASGVHCFDPADGRTTLLVAPERPRPGHRMNETKADRDGRLWSSTMRDFGLDDTGSLYRIDRSLRCEPMIGGLRVPNALCWSPDDRTMYFADTRDGRLRAYDFDRDSGRLGAMRILVDTGTLPGFPDGATVDAEGAIWSARYGGGSVARLRPDGSVDRVIRLPVTNPTSCTFGDADLRTLYITTARQRLSPAQLEVEPHAGALFSVRVEVGGLPEPECALRCPPTVP